MQISEMTTKLLSSHHLHYMLAVDAGAKVFQNLTAIWGYSKIEFQNWLQRHQNKIWCAESRHSAALKL